MSASHVLSKQPFLRLRTRLYRWRVRKGWAPIHTTSYLGHPFAYRADSLIGEQIARGEEWTSILRTIVSTLLPQQDPTICEVGSNIGASLLQMLEAKPGAHVIAFEPSDRHRPLLLRNVKAAGFTNRIEIYPYLVGRTRGKMWLHNNASTASVVSANYDQHQPRGKQLAEMTTLDDVLRDRGPVHFIKIDTDGFDLEVLRGSDATLKRDQPILFFELEVGLNDGLLDGLTWLQGLGYQRLYCFDYYEQFVGDTTDPHQAIAWANNPKKYCDVLVCPSGSFAETCLRGLDFSHDPAANT